MSTSAFRYRRPEHSEIKHKNMRFLITDRPTDPTIEKYIEVFIILLLNSILQLICFNKKIIKDLNKFNAGVVVRVCEPSYSTERLEQKGVKVIVSKIVQD